MKNKKTLIALAVMLLVVVGATIAYFTTTTTFNNEFDVATYKTKTTEEFTSPTNWKPGEEIAKTIVTTNEGSIPAAVRVSYKGVWTDAEGNELTDIREDAVIINLDNEDEWTKEGDYYYYNTVLNPGETTSSFIKSVTLNPEIGNETNCVTEGNKEVCESTETDIQGAKYTLTITKETAQYDSYQEAWSTSVNVTEGSLPGSITYVTRQNEGQITTGDVIKIGDTEEFYVVSSDAEETVLLAHYNLNVGDNKNPDVTEGIQHETVKGYVSSGTTYGTVAFDPTTNSSYWSGKVGAGLTYEGTVSSTAADTYVEPYPYVYDSNSNLYTYVENYKTILEETGAKIQTARLLSYSEAKALGCASASDYKCSAAPTFVSETTYWLGSANKDRHVIYISTTGYFGQNSSSVDTNRGVRPVIEIATSDLEAL